MDDKMSNIYVLFIAQYQHCIPNIGLLNPEINPPLEICFYIYNLCLKHLCKKR